MSHLYLAMGTLVHLRIHLPHVDVDVVHIPAAAVAESILGSTCYAASSILQHTSAVQQPPELSLRPGLLLALLRSPLWLIGIFSDLGGFAFQFLALRSGSLALVTPLFVVGLVFSIIGVAFVQHRRPTRSEWTSSSVVVVGLALFLYAAQPGPGHPRTTTTGWVSLFAGTIVVVGASVLLARAWGQRALWLGVGTGVLYGVTSAITERTGHLLNHGVLHALTTWTPYALAAVSLLGLLVNQSAFQAGSLSLSLPIMTVLEPLTAILIGQFLFGEHIASTSGARLGEIVGLALTTVGVFALARHAVDPQPAPV